MGRPASGAAQRHHAAQAAYEQAQQRHQTAEQTYQATLTQGVVDAAVPPARCREPPSRVSSAEA